MKATVNLDDRLYRRVKIKAAEDGVTVTSIFESALLRYLDGKDSGSESPVSAPAFELPVLKAAGGLLPGVDVTNGAELRRLMEQDEALEQMR
jgi:hypothetical protein